MLVIRDEFIIGFVMDLRGGQDVEGLAAHG